MPESPQFMDALQPMGRRARKALAVRRALFEAGLNAFYRQPIALVSILDITEAADVAKGVFYLQFRSKDDYLLALWQDVQRQCLENLRAAVLAAEQGSFDERLSSVIGGLCAFAKNGPAATRFWIRMSSYFPDEVGLPGELTRVREQYISELAALMAGTTESHVRQPDLRRAIVADALCWAAVAAATHSTEAPQLPVRAIEGAIRAALHAMAASSSRSKSATNAARGRR